MGIVKNAFALAASGLAISAVLITPQKEYSSPKLPKYRYISTNCDELYSAVVMPSDEPYLLYLGGPGELSFTKKQIMEGAKFLKISPKQIVFDNCEVEV